MYSQKKYTKKVYKTKYKGWKYLKARVLRKNQTPPEEILWQRIRKKQLGVRFGRQRVVRGYIVDFYCHKKRLVVEVDGKHHEQQKEYDSTRDKSIASIGFDTLRIPASMVLFNVDLAIELINRRLNSK